MLQCGGGNNTSVALLKEFFAHEKKCEEHFQKHAQREIAMAGHSPRRAATSRGTGVASPRRQPGGVRKLPGYSPNATGILPILTANSDIASLRRSPRRVGGRPGGLGGSSRRTPDGTLIAADSPRRTVTASPFDLPNQGIGYKVPLPPQQSTSNRRGEEKIAKSLDNPAHGRKPPYGRKSGTRDFQDDIGGGVACLHPAIFSKR